MNLHLAREESRNGCTFGHLSIDGVPFCLTLEDQVRELPGVPVATWKIYGETAIPAGRYRVTLRHSPRFGRIMPHVEDVEGYTGILLHWGSYIKDTHGCPLVGRYRGDGWLGKSKVTFDDLMSVLSDAKDEMWLTVENAPVKTLAA